MLTCPRASATLRAVLVATSLSMAAGCGGTDAPTTPPPAPPTIAVTVTPSSFSSAAGSTASAGLTVTRGGGFSGEVTLGLTGPVVTGLTVTVSPSTLGPLVTSATVLATVSAAVPPGVYPVTVVATATGSNQVTGSTPLTVTVTPAVTTTVTQVFCAAEAPIWVAYQDGSGPWTRVMAGANNTYSFQLTSALGGIATVDTVDTGFDLNVTYGTASELAAYSAAAGSGACGAKTLNGTAANIGATNFANMSIGNATVSIGGAGAGSQSYQLRSVPDGAQDLFASRASNTARRADKLILRRGVNIAAGGNIPVLDFNGAEAFAPATANVTVTGLTTDTAFVATAYDGTRGNAFGFLAAFLRYTTSSGVVPYDAIPGTSLNTGELQELYAVASRPDANRFAGVYFRAPIDRTLAFAPYMSAPTVTRATNAPYARPRVQVELQADYNRLLTVEFDQPAVNRSAGLTATRMWAGGSTWDLTFPDLSAAAGWNATWALQPSTAFTWSVAALGGAIYQLDANVSDGASFRSASVNSTAAVP